MIAQAQSGTGKTATFAVSILQRINTEDQSCQAIVLAPTRELAKQVRDCEKMSIGENFSLQTTCI